MKSDTRWGMKTRKKKSRWRKREKQILISDTKVCVVLLVVSLLALDNESRHVSLPLVFHHPRHERKFCKLHSFCTHHHLELNDMSLTCCHFSSSDGWADRNPVSWTVWSSLKMLPVGRISMLLYFGRWFPCFGKGWHFLRKKKECQEMIKTMSCLTDKSVSKEGNEVRAPTTQTHEEDLFFASLLIWVQQPLRVFRRKEQREMKWQQQQLQRRLRLEWVRLGSLLMLLFLCSLQFPLKLVSFAEAVPPSLSAQILLPSSLSLFLKSRDGKHCSLLRISMIPADFFSCPTLHYQSKWPNQFFK